MTLYFLRHAEAEDAADSDFNRSLTPKGREQASKAGKFLRREKLIPDLILTSPVLRALQTARTVADAVGADLVMNSWLACGMDPGTLLRELAPHMEKSSILLVGHEPDFSAAIALLLGAAGPYALNIRKASLAALVLHEAKAGSAQLQFLVPARLM